MLLFVYIMINFTLNKYVSLSLLLSQKYKLNTFSFIVWQSLISNI